MVEDRDKYYKEKHDAAHQALLIALNSVGAAGALAPQQVSNIAALLAMEGVSSDAVLSMLLNPSQQNFAAQQQVVPPSQGNQNFGNAAAGSGSFINRKSISLPLPQPQHQQQYQAQGNRFSAQPQPGQFGSAPSEYFLHQGLQPNNYNHTHHVHQHHPNLPPTAPTSGGSGSSNSRRSVSGPLPNNMSAFSSMMSREGSFSSLSTMSDWYSTNSSNRASLELGNTGFWGPNAGQPPARLSVDTALQLRQQLMAAASQQGGGVGGGGGQQLGSDADGSLSQAQLRVAHNMAMNRLQQQQSPSPSPPPAAVMQSAFYQSAAPVPIHNNHISSSTSSSASPTGGMQSVSSPIQGASSLPLPPIREGHFGPVSHNAATDRASAQFGGSILNGRGNGGGNSGHGSHPYNAGAVGGGQFVGGSPARQLSSSMVSPFISGPVSPPRPTPANNNNSSSSSNDDVTIQLGELSLSNNSFRGSNSAAGIPLGMNQDNSDIGSVPLSTRNSSGSNGLFDRDASAWQAPFENPAQKPSA